MQYGHNAPIRYRLWKISQCTNPAPASVPTARPTQYHRGSGTFVTASTPLTATTVNATIPSSGLGKPSTDACGVAITGPQDSTGLRLHDGTYAESLSSRIFSTVSVTEATSPISPPISTTQAAGGAGFPPRTGGAGDSTAGAAMATTPWPSVRPSPARRRRSPGSSPPAPRGSTGGSPRR